MGPSFTEKWKNFFHVLINIRDFLTPLTYKLFNIFILAIICLAFVVYYGYVLDSNSHDLNEIWRQYSQTETQKEKAITRIVRNFGYGGFIHHFKNYILRKDEKYYNWAKDSLKLTYEAMDDFLAIEKNEQNEKSIRAFKMTVDKYKGMLALSKRLKQMGLSTNDMDRVVYVDDNEARKALASLFKTVDTKTSLVENQAQEKTISNRKKLVYGFLFIIIFIMAATVYLVIITIQITKEYKESTVLFQSVPNAIIVADSEGAIIRCNEMAEILFGYKAAELLDLTVEDLIPRKYRLRHIEYRKKFQESEKTITMSNRNKSFSALRHNGSIFPADISISTYKVGIKQRSIAIIKDLTLEKQLKTDANTDYLTKLANRKYGENIITVAINHSNRYNTPLSLVICDIDHFKLINDTYGHDNGDKVLVKVAQLITAKIRKTDIVVRWGGEEFLIICPELDLKGAFFLAEKIRKLIRKKFKKYEKPLTVSLGVTQYRIAQEDQFHLFKRADKALYVSKNNGRDQTNSL